MAVGYMKGATFVALDDILALHPTDLSLKRSLSMADPSVYATASIHDCPLYTSDAYCKGLPLVHHIPAD